MIIEFAILFTLLNIQNVQSELYPYFHVTQISTARGNERSKDSLILYESTYGITTNTNQWGYEVIVEASSMRVVGATTSNSVLQEGFLTLSGHGKAAEFLSKYARPGNKLVLEDKQLGFIDDVDSEWYRVKQAVSSFQKPSDTETQLSHTIQSLINEAEADPTNISKAVLADEIQNLSYINQLKAIPLKEGYRKYIWYRFHDFLPRQMEDSFREIAEFGFTDVLIQVIDEGKTHYPSQYLPVSDLHKGWDALEYVISLAKKNKLRIHAWMPTLFAGQMDKIESPELLKAAAIPLNQDFSKLDRVILCPAKPVTKQLLENLLHEILIKYPFDGLHFDYIRFPQADHPETMLCGCPFCKSHFHELYPVYQHQNWPPFSSETFLQDFSSYRHQSVSNLFNHLVRYAKQIKPDLFISAAVFPNIVSAKKTLGQDWSSWVKDKIVDGIFPMCYTANEQQFKDQIDEFKTLAEHSEVELIIGQGPMHTLSVENLIARIVMTRPYFEGEAIYAYELLGHQTKEFYFTQNKINQIEVDLQK